MNDLKINTNQNILLNYKLASVGDRILAYLLDGLILTGYVFLILAIFFVITYLGGKINVESLNPIWFLFAFIFYLPVMFYSLVCEQYLNGQTIGKKVLKIKVVKEDGSQPTFGSYFTRWIVRLVDFSLSYGSAALLSIILTEKSQRIGDLAAKTVVIKLTQKLNLSDTIFKDVEETHLIKYNNVLNLKDEEIELTAKVLQQTNNANNKLIIEQLANRIRTVIEVEKDELSDIAFLNRVIKDYNFKSINA